MSDVVRLQKFLSQAGVASRRRAEAMIRAGRVRVNDSPVTQLGVKVQPGVDLVEVDGRRIEPAALEWIALHKPRGVLSTRRDPQGRATIYDLLPQDFGGLFYVGRLDRDSEGLMLLTNQGDIAHRLLHPRYGIDRVYGAVVQGEASDEDVRRLLEGVELEDGVARAQAVERRPTRRSDCTRLRLTLREGRKREVRRMLRALGLPVRRLVRLRYGPIRLGRLGPGRWRRLSRAEIAALARPTNEE